MNKEKNNLEIACRIATKYGAVLPLDPCGKKPLGKLVAHGFKDATCDVDLLIKWWDEEPSANIGLVTGSNSGLIVLDIDPRNGGDESLKSLEECLGDLPSTLTVVTGGGGKHLYFKYPNGIKLPVIKDLATGVDLKSDGGYVVAPGSTHQSGEPYYFIDETIEISELPQSWIDRIFKQNSKRLSAEDANAQILQGKRNVELTSIAGTLRQRGLQEKEIFDSLSSINLNRCKPPLESKEISSIARSVSKYEPNIGIAPINKEYLSPDEIDKRLSVNTKQAQMDYAKLPKPFFDYLQIVKKSTAAPDEFIVISFIGLVAAAMGKEILLKWPLGFIKPHVWIACIAPSGIKKTTALSITKKLCTPLERSRRELRKEKLIQYGKASAKYSSSLKKDGIDSGNEPSYPSVRGLLLPTLSSKQQIYTTLAKDYAGGVIYEESELSTLLYDWKNDTNSGMASVMMSLLIVGIL
jgi:hypothetical protein